MAVMDGFRQDPLPPKWQSEANAWQGAYFPELGEVQDEKEWKKYYPRVPLTQLTVITAKPEAFAQYASKVVGATPATADLTDRYLTSDRMNDGEFMTALKIIRAQASTELGSIQQHRMVYEPIDHGSVAGMDRRIAEGIHNVGDGHTLDRISFSAKRVCIEELRHHYQMSGVITLDRTWDEPRWGRHWATETMEELFAMKPGEHVLDAFNIEFRSLLDTATFLCFIDRVGKYQLEMQHHFRYAPMALSMPYMRWWEESYHLAAGEQLVKALAVAATSGAGDFPMAEVQKTLNMWYPRGLEMFGSELGGALVKGVFKTLSNEEAEKIYIDEVTGKVKETNLAVIMARAKCSREEAEGILGRIQRGELVHGLGREDLLHLPDRRFYRYRGLKEFGDYTLPGAGFAGVGYVYLPYDVNGNLLTEKGRPMEREPFVEYLHTVLPDRYVTSKHFAWVKDEFLFNPKWGDALPVHPP